MRNENFKMTEVWPRAESVKLVLEKLTAEFRASEENILEENMQRYLSVLRPIRLDPKPEDLEEIYKKHISPPLLLPPIDSRRRNEVRDHPPKRMSF